MQRSHARGHSAKPPAAAAQLVCRRRSRQQLGACADEPHTNRKISRRPFSRCATCWPTPKTKHTIRACAAGSHWAARQAAQLTLPTSTSMSSELGWARYITKERFMMPRPQLQQAAALVIMLDIHTFRHTGAATSRWPASSRRAAAAARRSARGPHAPRSSPRTRIAATSATSATSEKTNGIARPTRRGK